MEKLLGHNGPNQNTDDEDEYGTKYIEWTRAVYAMGIAVGLQLRPSAFDEDGAP